MTPPDELAVLRLELAELTRLSFEACRRAAAGETIYAYALVAGGASGEAFRPWCHSEEALARRAARSPGRAAAEGGFWRYCPDEWWSIVGDPGRTRRGWDLDAVHDGLAAAHEQFRGEDPYVVLELMVDALESLDREGFFGTGAAREAATLMISVSDDPVSGDWWPDSVRRLNPPAVVDRFRAAVP